VHDSELIIVGNVVDQNSEGTVVEKQVEVPEHLTKVPAIRNTVEVEKVIKGNYEGRTIDLITEGDLSGNLIIEGPAKFQKGEKTILFLHREKVYSGEYTTMGMEQGKFQVNTNGSVEGKLMADAGYDTVYWPLNATSIADFEIDIKNILTEPKPKEITVEVAPGDRDLADRDLTLEEIKELETERNTTGDYVVK
jgi:hypothetical protein